MRFIFLCFLFCVTSLQAFTSNLNSIVKQSKETSPSEFRFKEQLQKGQKGDFIVVQNGKLFSLIAIKDLSQNELILEEISIFQDQLTKNFSWKTWITNKAPGHTSWNVLDIDLKAGKIKNCYSISKKSWVNLSENESLLTKLLNLPMKPLPKDLRRKIGPPPMSGEQDLRPLWNPPVTIDGHKKEHVDFAVFQMKWPSDESELSGKYIDLFFLQNDSFPFPYWIQITSIEQLSVIFRVVDSGKALY